MGRHDRLERKKYEDSNALRHWTHMSHPIVFTIRSVFTWLAQLLPIRLKNAIYRLIGVNIGDDVAIGMKAVLDPFNPDMITIGDGSTIGFRTTILTHEATTNELREGPVTIGDDVLIGTNCTVLPGVEIGDGATVSAHTLVNKDVPAGASVGGTPMQEINVQDDEQEEDGQKTDSDQ